MAHDFNNMLNVIIGHVDLLREDVPEESPWHRDLGQIYKAAQRSASLTRQLLAFARKQVIAPEPVNINEAVKAIYTMLQRLISEEIILSWSPGAALQPVLIDPAQLDQILVNMVVNARDAIGHQAGEIIIESRLLGGAEIAALEVAEDPSEAYVLLSISDTGCGIPEEAVEHIFEPFFTTKEQGAGTGLGLATVYGIVKQNRGFIRVQSTQGIGTCFDIVFPALDRVETAAAPASTLASRGEQPELTILLVEDELAILSCTSLLLERAGHRVLAASTPGEALRMANKTEHPIDLVISDVILPERSGHDLVVELKTLFPAIQHLFMSGYTADIIGNHGILAEGVNFIQKPFEPGKLLEKIADITQASPAH